MGPEVELKEETPGDEPDPNELLKVEAGLTMVWNDFERIAEERRKSNLWDMEGVLVSSLESNVHSRTPTNAEIIKIIYRYEFDDDLTTSDEVYYRHCQPPSNEADLFRRHSFRVRRYDYFHRPAIRRGNLWFPEKYLPDPEDPEWSWKEGIELHKPAQSAYQLNKGAVFWDPSKHKRNKGGHPYYRDPNHRLGTDQSVPPSPVVHMLRPTAAMVRFPAERFPKSEYNAAGPQDLVLYHPK